MPLDSQLPSTDRRLSDDESSPRLLPHPVTETGSGLWSRSSTRLLLEDRYLRQLRLLSDRAYPYEACGILVGQMKNERVVVCQVLQAPNLSELGNRDRYVLDPEAFLVAEKSARDLGLRVVGIWHSHPNHPADPSTKDLESAWHGYSYVIVSVDALGDTVLRSWRLRGGRLVTEPIEVLPDRSA